MRRALLAVILAWGASACSARGVVIAPSCAPTQRLAIVAQSVPSATSVPCVGSLPTGWSAGGVEVARGTTTFWLDSDRAGNDAVKVELRAACAPPRGATAMRGHAGAERFGTSHTDGQRVHLTRYDVFTGGCVVSTLDLPRATAATLADEADAAVVLYPRDRLRAELRARSGLDIGAPTR